MNIYLTYDYELFFGNDSGTVEKCMLLPTKKLMKLCEGRKVRMTFFVDVGYLLTAEKYPELTEEVSKVKAQIHEMIEQQHDVQLHIHPHWEKSSWSNGRWSFGTDSHYKLSDFSKKEAAAIVRKYKNYLEGIIGRPVSTFRAGGWCIQPFDHLEEVFKETGIRIDSSVIPGDFLETASYAIDFREAPMKSNYRFQSDITKENQQGDFIEYPIGSLRYSPLFFWRLYILGRLFPAKHKMVGDGNFLSQGGRKKRKLTQFTIGHVSTDGYYASKLDAAVNKYENLQFDDLVIIGHPKGNTAFSVEQLSRFIQKYHNKHQFLTFQQVS
ncbi:MAG: hypothetical protein Crog4KO_14090 [Crocinitomicaceae bacterium]